MYCGTVVRKIAYNGANIILPVGEEDQLSPEFDDVFNKILTYDTASTFEYLGF